MYIENEGFISDIFNGSESTSNIGDVRQTLEYNLVKAYPSVNSSNGGQIHSEENVRWLTRQFVKKPFIIQYDNNDMKEFQFQGAVLNAGTTTGGMVNLDGYIINTAEDMKKLSFDNSQDTMLGTGDPYGYIYHTTLQKAFQAFIEDNSEVTTTIREGLQPAYGLIDSDITKYIQETSAWDWDVKKREFLINYVENNGFLTFERAGYVQIQYTGDLLNYINEHWSKLIPNIVPKDTPSEIVFTDNYYIYKIDTTHKFDTENPYILVIYNVNYGYIKEKWEYVKDGTIQYNVVDPETHQTITKDFPNYTPLLFIKDIFSFLYVFQSDLDLMTNSYTGQLNTDMNFLQDTVTPNQADAENKIIFSTNNIYDMSKCYTSYTDKDCNIVQYSSNTMITVLRPLSNTNPTQYGEFAVGNETSSFPYVDYDTFLTTYLDDRYGCKYIYKKLTSSPSDWPTGYYIITSTAGGASVQVATDNDSWENGYTKEYNTNYMNFQVKLPNLTDNESLNNIKIDNIKSNFFTDDNTIFNIQKAEAIFKEYRAYESVDITSDLIEGQLKKICDEYYCLPLNKISGFVETFCRKIPGTSTVIPVGFITSNGALMANNVEYTKVVDGNTEKRVLVEGYASLLRRICKIVAGYDGETEYKRNDISDSNVDGVGWRLLIKDLQTGNLVRGESTIANEIYSIFDITNIDDLTFDVIYNKIIAPYMNFYLQLAWSTLIDNTLINRAPIQDGDNTQHGRYKAREAYTIMQSIDPGDAEVVRNDGNVYTLRIPRTYTFEGNNIVAKKDVEYVYQKFTDADRFMNFLCVNDKKYVSTTDDKTHNIYYKNKVNFNNETNAINLFEDYISYLKHCTQRGWDFNLQDSNHTTLINDVWMTIPYKVTSLEPNKTGDIYNYGFKTLDKDSNDRDIMFDSYTRYTNKFYENNNEDKYNYSKVYVGSDSQDALLNIKPGYIQNVCIRTDNFTPCRIRTYQYYFPKQYNGINVNTSVTETKNANVYTINPLLIPEYTLWLDAYKTNDYAGHQEGLSGFCAHGYTQGWAACVPMLFRLYKDGQHYLNGRLAGTTHHNGIYVDYKLPCEVTNDDFWFANSWMSNVRSVGRWEIENASVKTPSGIDDMSNYLDIRNRTLFNVDTIYAIDDKGEYISMADYVKNMIINYGDISSGGGSSGGGSYEELEQRINQLQFDLTGRIDGITNTINRLPFNNYVEYPLAASVGRIVTTQTTSGLVNNVNRLKTYVDNMSYQAKTTASSGSNELYIANNRYYNLTNYANSTLRIVTPPEEVMEYYSTTFNERYVINTTDIDNNNGVIKTTVKVSKSSVALHGNKLELRLGTLINKFNDAPVSNALKITWGSNYKVEFDEEVSEYVIYIEDKLATTLNCLLEITIMPDKENGKASGYVNVLTYSNENSITLMDMNYLWRELYSIENVSWSHLAELTRAGLAPKFYKLGDTKTFEVTYNRVTYNIPATIIGFDAEKSVAYDANAYPHTITWMTNIHGTQDVTNIEDVELFRWEITPNVDDVDPQHDSESLYGYNYYDFINNKFFSPNTFYINRITRYTKEEFLNTIIYMRKTTGITYTCKSTNGVYKVVKSITDGTIGSASNTINTHINELKFWFPSVSELGLYFRTDDPVEQYIQEHPSQEQTRTNNTLTINAKLDDINTTFLVSEVRTRDGDLVYPYFTLPDAERNVCPKLIVLSSYYDVNYNLVSGEDQNTFITQYKTLEPTSVGFKNKFGDCSRYQYIAYKDNPHSNNLVIRPRTLTENIYSTDFCFTTG